MKYINLVILSAILLSGCAVTNDLVRIESIGKNDSILVISQFDEKLKIKSVGTTSFTNGLLAVDIQDWDINGYIEGQIVEKLSDNYAVVTSPDLRYTTSKPDYNYFTLKKYPIQGEGLLEYTESQNTKYIIVLSPMKYQDPYFNTNQQLEGFGIYQRGLLGSQRKRAFLQMFFWVYDGKTREYIASGGVGNFNDIAPSWITSRNIALNWVKSKEEVGTEYLDLAEKEIKNMFSILIDRNLKALKLKAK